MIQYGVILWHVDKMFGPVMRVVLEVLGIVDSIKKGKSIPNVF